MAVATACAELRREKQYNSHVFNKAKWTAACLLLGERLSPMIRILTNNEPGGITVTVDGQLVGEYVNAVDSSVDQAMGEGKPVHLSLRDVSHIDEGARKLLSRLASEGVELSASGIYSSYIVAELGRKGAEARAAMLMNGTSVDIRREKRKCGL